MESLIKSTTLIALLAPLIGALIAGLSGKKIPQRAVQMITIIGVVISLLCSLALFQWVVVHHHNRVDEVLYIWGVGGHFPFALGLLVDHLTVVMMLIVSFISLVVHIYSVGYMRHDPGNRRFFCYASLFTFAMLLLVSANNFLQLFIGWEGVGLVSYLLIGFWYEKKSAVNGSLKAFLVNRVGDLGFILALAAILDYFGSFSYHKVFTKAPGLLHTTLTIFPHHAWSVLSVIAILLFVGAMAKSAQVPLHVWLPESMEGPTPISALIHAATMVTAGVFMVVRMSPLFELSQVALSMILILGATTALFLGLVACVQTDIKRVIAWSTISQLGYMMVANGASVYAAGIFHLLTHACFKALLFLAAGSVILALDHEQDMRKMGGLAKYMPITYLTFLLGALALAAIPPFSGFFSKDSIIEAVHLSTIPGASYAYVCVLLGSFVTAFYIFRALFLTFHGQERLASQSRNQLKESPWVVTIPLIVLAIPTVFLGGLLIHWILYTPDGLLGHSIKVLPWHHVLGCMQAHFHGVWQMIAKALVSLVFWFSASGMVLAWLFYIACPKLPAYLAKGFSPFYQLLVSQFGFDAFNQWVWVRGGQRLSRFCYRLIDKKLIDRGLVDGSARSLSVLSQCTCRLQSGLLYQYILMMLIALLVFLCWTLLG